MSGLESGLPRLTGKTPGQRLRCLVDLLDRLMLETLRMRHPEAYALYRGQGIYTHFAAISRLYPDISHRIGYIRFKIGEEDGNPTESRVEALAEMYVGLAAYLEKKPD